MDADLLKELDELIPHDPEYGSKRLWLISKLKEKYPERELINFHYTPSGPPWATKEELWKEIDKMVMSEAKPLNFRDSRRINYDDNSESNS